MCRRPARFGVMACMPITNVVFASSRVHIQASCAFSGPNRVLFLCTPRREDVAGTWFPEFPASCARGRLRGCALWAVFESMLPCLGSACSPKGPLECPWSALGVPLECPWSVLGVITLLVGPMSGQCFLGEFLCDRSARSRRGMTAQATHCHCRLGFMNELRRASHSFSSFDRPPSPIMALATTGTLPPTLALATAGVSSQGLQGICALV